MTLWLRLKMALKGFTHALVPAEDYLVYRNTVVQPIETKRLRKSHQQARGVITKDTQLKKLLGKGRYVIEVTVRDGRPLVAVFKGFEDRAAAGMGARTNGREQYTRRSIFSFSYLEAMIDPNTNHGPITLYYNPNDPVFAYDPKTEVHLILTPVPYAREPRWRY